MNTSTSTSITSRLLRGLGSAAAVAAVVFITGCASAPSVDKYTSDELMQRQTEEAGHIVQQRHVRIQAEATGVGALIGASVGGGLASNIGKGNGAKINSGLGGLAGAIAGGIVEDRLRLREATELSVRLANGALISVVVPGRVDFTPGTAVRVLTGLNGWHGVHGVHGYGSTRVVPALAPSDAGSTNQDWGS
jgi:outer membrane lipoprotein SlyB